MFDSLAPTGDFTMSDMSYLDAIAYLTRCADDNGNHYYSGQIVDAQDCPTCHGTNDAGHLRTPGSRYGHTSAHCAPVAHRVARIDGDTSASHLDAVMSAVVNDSDGPEATLQEYAIGFAGADVDAMVSGYLECQLWAQTDFDSDDESMLDANYSVDDIDAEYVERVRAELTSIVVEHPLAVRMYLQHRDNGSFGHDLYLTREGHGAGFWDRGLGELGDYLTDIAKYAGAADALWDNGNGVLA